MNYILFAVLQNGKQIDYLFAGEVELKLEKDELNVWVDGECCASLVNVKMFLLMKNQGTS